MLYIPLVWFGKLLLFATRLRGGGSALPGLVVEKLQPRFIEHYAGSFDDVVLVAGTNGKTTTTRMLRYILEGDGRNVLTNAAGSNMPRGVISAILASTDWKGRVASDTGLFEVDEGFLSVVAEVLRPRTIVVLNLLRDQLDRYGELDRTSRLIGQALPHAEHAVLNVDDPRVAALAEHAGDAVLFGAAADIRAQVPHDDALHARSGTERRAGADPVVDIRSAVDTDDGQEMVVQIDEQEYTVGLQVSGIFNAYNAAAALATARTLRIDTETSMSSLRRVAPAFGRSERIQIGDKEVMLLLVKNPGGFNQIINTYLRNAPEKPVLIAINDNYADGRDVSWLWDVNIEHLDGAQRTLYTGGIRAHDMALRLQYAELGAEPETDFETALKKFIEAIPDGGRGYIVPTYTAMLALRKRLGRYADLPEAGE